VRCCQIVCQCARDTQIPEQRFAILLMIVVSLTFARWNRLPAGFDSSMASVRLRDRDLTAGLRSP
jgi:hypothetical protein